MDVGIGELKCEGLQTEDTEVMGSHDLSMANLIVPAVRHSGSRRNAEFWRVRLGYRAVALGRS